MKLFVPVFIVQPKNSIFIISRDSWQSREIAVEKSRFLRFRIVGKLRNTNPYPSNGTLFGTLFTSYYIADV